MADTKKQEKKTSTKPKAEKEVKETVKNEVIEFSGKYISSVGRRKRSVAQVRLYEGGKGVIIVNEKKASDYFPGEGHNIIAQPLKVTGHGRDYNFSVLVKGGGKSGQIDAVKLGIARSILEVDPEAKEALKANDFLTRDPRQVERKKPGLKKARKAPQWSKR
jgi:small subunit ribosomal protein S9